MLHNTHLCANQARDAVHQAQLLAHLEALVEGDTPKPFTNVT
jgi:hypothetical protein